MPSSASVNTLQRFGLKLFLKADVAMEPRSIVPVFHRWIQTGAVRGLLIDVADYTHLVNGPSVLLVGHEGNYALDYRDGRPGLYYYRKRSADGTLADRLVTLGRTVLEAGALLESDDAVGPGLRFRGDELEFVINDRLVPCVDDDLEKALLLALTDFLRRLYLEQAHEVAHAECGGDRPTFTLRSAVDVSIATLLERLK